MAEFPPCQGREVLVEAFGQDTIPLGANPGLVFDRYLRLWYERGHHWELSAKGDGSEPEKHKALGEFCKAYASSKTTGSELLAARHERLNRIARTGTSSPGESGAVRTYRTRWRVVTGLGGHHPLENGFAFDRSIGVPFFPGSSVKGLCRAAAEGLLAMDDTELIELFGAQPENGDRSEPSVGALVFLPAYPAEWPRLAPDIVNNHHPTYYRGLASGAQPPRVEQTDSPVPVYFLTVCAGTPFKFRLTSRSTDAAVASAQIARGFQCLELGLDYLGIGAKTAAGYGTFEVSNERSTSESSGNAKPKGQPSIKLTNGARVHVEVTPERSNKGKVRVRELQSGQVGGLHPTSKHLPDETPGTQYEVVVFSNGTPPVFKFD